MLPSPNSMIEDLSFDSTGDIFKILKTLCCHTAVLVYSNELNCIFVIAVIYSSILNSQSAQMIVIQVPMARDNI